MYKTTSIVSATILAAMLGWTPANAADLGDDCCADLEERVNELEATTVRKGNRKVSVKLSGQVNTGILYWDDGNENDIYVVDNTSSSSRFIISGSAKIHHGWSAGFHEEIEITRGATSAAVTQLDDDGGKNGDAELDIRKMYWWIKSDQLGKIAVGQNSPATDDITLVELGGTGVVSTDTNLWGRMLITQGNFDAIAGASGANAVVLSFDTTSRSNIVRYDSPVIAGFTLTAAWGEDDIWDVALRYAGEFSGVRVALAAGYIDTTDDTTATVPTGNTANGQADSRFMGSASALHVPSGLFLTGFWNFGDDGAAASQDSENWGFRGGWRGRLTSLGHTSVFAGYRHSEVDNLGVNIHTGGGVLTRFTGNQEAMAWEAGVVQRIDAAAMELFLAYKRYEFDIRNDATGANGNANDQDYVFAGARVKF